MKQLAKNRQTLNQARVRSTTRNMEGNYAGLVVGGSNANRLVSSVLKDRPTT